MISQQLRTLLEPPSTEESNVKTISFLNSRFESLDNLNELEYLVLLAQQRNDELQTNLSWSRSKIDALLVETQSSAEMHFHTAQELSLLRHSLTDELSDLSNELVSAMSDGERKSTLLEDIETLHRNLKELQSVKGYVQIIQHTLDLSEKSVQEIRTAGSPVSSASLGQYRALQDFVARVSEACASVEDGSGQQTLHLVVFLNKVRDKTWVDIKGALSKTLTDISEKIGWPMPVDYLTASSEAREHFEKAFLNLLKLQSLGEKIRLGTTAPAEKDPLYSVQALVHPVSLRFKYHFEGSRQTNRLDKPEWYFTHVLNVVHEHRPFMESVIQKLLASSEYNHINAWREFTFQLLPLLSRKLKHTIPSLLPHPPLLAHTIYQALTFDAALSEEGFQLLETSAIRNDKEGTWEGVSEVILGNLEWFEVWLLGEKRFAEDQYHEIISAADAWLVADEDDENPQGSHVRATNSARRIKALVEQVTDRYSPLPNFNQRTRFLLSIQLPLLENYHGRIASSLDAFETLSSAFVRAVPGALNVSLGGKEEGSVHVDTRRLTSGVEGVQRLCKALLSARYVETSMESWGEELFFLELWAEIKRKPALRSRVAAHHLLPDTTSDGPDVHQDVLFDELISQYRSLIARAEEMIIHQVCGEIESGLKAHFMTTPLTSSSGPTDDISLSQTLLPPIALLSSHLTFLRLTFPQSTLTRLYRRIASRLSEHILQRQIIYRGHFEQQEARNILAECELWVQTCHGALGGGLGGGRERVDAPWGKLLQAAGLASAEGELLAAIVDATFGSQTEEEWETSMTQITGAVEMGREEVARILKRRSDSDR